MTDPDAITSDSLFRVLAASGRTGTPSHGPFDRIAGLAVQVLRAPTALVSLVGGERFFLVGVAGEWPTVGQTPEAVLHQTMCREVVARQVVVAEGDCRGVGPARDGLQNPLGVAYLGVPLARATGEVVGALCVIDRVPRDWSADDVSVLTDLASGVVAEIDLALARERARHARRLLAKRARAAGAEAGWEPGGWDDADDIASPTSGPASAPGLPEFARRFSGRILLADDSPDNQQVLIYVLRRFGLVPDIVTDGRGAITAALSRPYDLILMDMKMADIDGYEATRQLRRSGYHRPIVAVTSHSLSGDRDRCLAAGCDEYLSKPIDVRLLEAVLARYLAPAHAADAAGPGNVILSEMASDPTLRALIADYAAALPRRMSAIRAAFTAGDAGGTVAMAHQLKGSGGMYGYDSLSEVAGLLELAVKEGREPDLVSALIDELDAIARRIGAGISPD
jgi:CheY-like chemotaxis protein/HPt (histidine-containing phosphotransfer) domain-containing protein